MNTYGETQTSARRRVGILFILGMGVLCIIALGYSMSTLNAAPAHFPVGVDIVVEEGLTVREITDYLEDAGVIRSSLYIYIMLARNGYDTNVQAGIYRFDSPKTTTEIFSAITTGTSMSPHITITFPEGFKAEDLYTILPDSFIKLPYDITQYEGYLFPDTYFISRDMTTEDIVTLMRDTFTEKLASYEATIADSGFTLNEVITLASIIEREAKDTTSKRLISGILQNRLTIGMPLQVDAVFDYLLNKTSDELTTDDLEIDSPYNTYKYRGLPPGPIANPGIDSIEAVLFPTKTEYLYYLTADDGTFYYAEAFEEHKENKAKYLK